jgi:polar amino acid transport system substrate-binding protein
MKKALVLFVSFLAIACPAYAEVKQLHIGLSTGYPPFYFFDENKQPTGICIDIINQVAQSMNISVHYDSYPWKRMLNYGKEGKIDAVMPLFKTDEREQFLTFPELGLIDEDNNFFTHSSNTISYSGKLADVINYKIGVIDKYSYGKEFDNTDFTDKTIVQDTQQLILLVQKKRIELGLGNAKVVTYIAKKIDAADKIHFLSPPVTINSLFIGFSKKRVNQDFVNQFNKQLQKFKSTEAYTDIIQAY